MVHSLTLDEVMAIKNQRAYLIDVRSDEEVSAQTISSAIHWDVRQMTEGRFPNMPKDVPVFVFCRSGNRSSVAQRLLGAAGFTDSHDLGGVNSIPNELK